MAFPYNFPSLNFTIFTCSSYIFYMFYGKLPKDSDWALKLYLSEFTVIYFFCLYGHKY